MIRKLAHVIGFDDAPFDPVRDDDVLAVGAVFSQLRLEGVLSGKVRRDGSDATRVLIDLISHSKFSSHLQAASKNGR